MFGPDEENAAMYTALHNAANASFDEIAKLYDYIEEAPRTSLVVELVDELHELGFEIVRKKPDWRVPCKHVGNCEDEEPKCGESDWCDCYETEDD